MRRLYRVCIAFDNSADNSADLNHVLGLLRKIAYPEGPALSTTAPSCAVTPVVTAAVTADVAEPELTANSTAVVTTEVTDAIASTIASSRIIRKWADPKPLPMREEAPPGGNAQIWPVDCMLQRFPTAEEIAQELYAAMQRQPACAGRFVLAQCIEDWIYPSVCEQLGWPPRPWLGRSGVAAYLAKLSEPKYRRVEIGGEQRNLLHYYISYPPPAAVVRIDARRKP